MLEHGGRLRKASIEFGIPLEKWIDLSTGINPSGWPAPTLPQSIWQRLPEDDDHLICAAKDYYNAENLLPVSGSQAAIQTLPNLRKRSKVGMLALAYNEHQYAWKKYGHDLILLSEAELRDHLPNLDVLVLCNPNNPTGFRVEPGRLMKWAEQLSSIGGWLVIDEAFVDSSPEFSVASETGRTGLVVLRSLGKFFGLAGARVGFVLAWQILLDELQNELGPWPISTPSRWLATAALNDVQWQNQNRQILKAKKSKLVELLANHQLNAQGESDLFTWVQHQNAKAIANQLAEQAILVRYFDNPSSLRFGLPGSDETSAKLDAALNSCGSLIQTYRPQAVCTP